MRRWSLLPAVACSLVIPFSGCQLKKVQTDHARLAPQPEAYVPETVATHTRLVEGRDIPVRGHCVVVGLGRNGSSEVPASLKKYLVQYLLREGRLNSYSAGTPDLTPGRFLTDRDTAVVEVRGEIPAGAPRGTRFDVMVSALPETGTTSLDGGNLMPTDLRLAYGPVSMAGQGSGTMAYAGGAIFVNPFIKRDDPASQMSLRQGRIIGGGIVSKSRTIRLSLKRPDFGMARRIQQRINERFSYAGQVAVGKNSSIIEITIPARHRGDYHHFLDLLMHVPMQAAGGQAMQTARRICKAIQQADADYEGLALVLEGIGRQVLPIIREVYRSRNQAAAYYAARAGMRLDDDIAADVVLHFAKDTRSGLQLQAVRELGHHRHIARAGMLLRDLLDSTDDLVREAAYESLLQRGDGLTVRRVRIAQDFYMDIVAAKTRPSIFVTQTGMQRIVLFGRNIPVRIPVFYSAPGDLAGVNAARGDAVLKVARKLPRTGRYSESLACDPNVVDLIRTLGSPAAEEGPETVRGLWLTYSQVVGIVANMCKSGSIGADFRLQTPADYRRIYQRNLNTGRPDMPGS